MRSRTYPPGVAAHVAEAGQHGDRDKHQGWSHRRLIALLDGALEREARQREYRLSRGWPALPQSASCTLGKPRYNWGASEWYLWGKLTKSQAALWLSGFVETQHGGDRLFESGVEYDAARYRVSRRMLFLALKLRRSGNAILIRAVAEGGVSLGDAVAHLEHDTGELRKAIRMVERKEARSLRQALETVAA
jgi:hypothetical protein